MPVRIRILSCVVIVVLIVIIVAVSADHAGSGGGQTLSYKDGYVLGQRLVTGDYTSNTTIGPNQITGSPTTDCSSQWLAIAVSGGTSDDESQWTSGCLDGYNAAQYAQAHPGASR